MRHITILLTILICLFPSVSHSAESELFLKNNLSKAIPGDYIITAQNKNYTLLVIRSKDPQTISIDEITLPQALKPKDKTFSWKQWITNGAPGHTCWVMYSINLETGIINNAFSFTKNEWFSIPQSQNFLSTLLNLRLTLIPENERKKIGPSPASDSHDRRSIWQPPLIVEGQTIRGTSFDAWRTHWPKDNSELSGRTIEIYLPKDNKDYPSYFPYWLQIHGIIGKAKVRIIDSGSKLILSPSTTNNKNTHR